MTSSKFRLWLTVAICWAVAGAGSPAFASFHVMSVAEVFGGTAGSPNAQFVELRMDASGQNQVQNHPVTVFDAAGTQVGSFTFSSAVAASASGSTILVATTEAQTLFGVTADLTMTAVIARGGGKVCFDSIDCTTWGAYTGSGPAGTPFNRPEGLLFGSSQTKTTTTANGDPSTNYTFAAPTPRNNAGAAFAASCAPGFSAASFSVAENVGSAVVSVAGCAGTTISYSTADGTATAGSDYAAVSGTLTFTASGTKSFAIPITADCITEATETVMLRLRDQSDTYLGRANAVLSISNTLGTPTAPPSSPRNLTATAGSGSIALSWLPPVSDGGCTVSSYKIYRGTSSGTETLLATSGSSLSFTDTGLPASVTRFYTVTAFNGLESVASNEAFATTPGASPPTVPLSFAAQGGVGAITLSWSPPASNGGSTITGYRVYRGDSAVTLTLRATTGVTGSYSDSGLASGVTFFYAVSAVNIAGEGPRTAAVSARTITTPGAPEAVTASPAGGVGQIRVTWSPPVSDGGAAVTQYRVYRAEGTGAETLIATVSAPTSSYIDSGRTLLTSYRYSVTAANIAGEGQHSATSCAKPFPWLAALGCPA